MVGSLDERHLAIGREFDKLMALLAQRSPRRLASAP